MRELDHSLNPVAPSALVVYADIESVSQHILTARKQQADFASTEDFIRYLTHEVNNVFHSETGRINMGIDANGVLYANSVSPYSETFLANIEPKIKPLVEALHKKRYLTYSSCDGHGNTFRRYVGLAFADDESREYVARQIEKLRLPGVKIKYMDTVSNMKIDAAMSKRIKYSGKMSPAETKTEEQSRLEIEGFNVQFHRNYESYVFLEIIILEEVYFDRTFLANPLKSIWLCFMKKFFWDYLTSKITAFINSSEFKKYPY